MAQPYTTIRRSAYNAWIPQSNLIHDSFVLGLLKLVDSEAEHKPAVKAFDAAVSPAQKELFQSALIQVQQYYAKVWENGRHDHKLIFLH